MKIDLKKNGSALLLALDGRLDTTTAPALENAVNDNIGGADSLVIDCRELAYVSSAGLRVLLATQKKMKGEIGRAHV